MNAGLGLVRELSSRLATAKTVAEVLRAVEEAWPTAMRDLPFTLTYLFDDDLRQATLVAHTGVHLDNAVAAPTIAVGSVGLWPVAEVLARRQAILVDPLPDGI